MKTIFYDLIHLSHCPWSISSRYSEQTKEKKKERQKTIFTNVSTLVSKWGTLFEIKDDNLDFFSNLNPFLHYEFKSSVYSRCKKGSDEAEKEF